eukprot:Pgem_evm2s17345
MLHYRDIKAFMEAHHYAESQVEPCLFRDNKGNTLLTYVDDYYHSGADKTIIQQLQSRYPLKNMGTPTTYVGIQISRTKHETILHQQRYIERAMLKHNIPHKRYDTPLPTAHTMDKIQPPTTRLNEEETTYYYSKLGTIRHLADTCRPDVAYSAHKLATHNTNPHHIHLKMAIRVLQYLHTTKQWGLRHQPGRQKDQAHPTLQLYTDSSQALKM